MKKLVEIDDSILTKLKVLSAFEGLSVKALMEKAIDLFVKNKEKEQLDSLSKEEKEDIGLLLLMQQADRTKTVSREEVFKLLE
jgi:phage-related tail protein|tara:strand:- start:540 stop:788 length:249 start_codon:yes stop_codon:yes gene_type:complete